MKVPGNDYYPEEWDSEDYLSRDTVLALNAARIGKATPYQISPQIAEFTRQFSEEAMANNTGEDLSQYNSEEWKNQYTSGKSTFVPENRWTHEVQRGPVKVSDNLYALYLDADIYITDSPRFYHDSANDGSFGKHINFVSRTLYKYIIDTGEIEKKETYENCMDEEYSLSIYAWVIRWTPYKKSRLTFYTTPEIDKELGCKFDKFVVDCDESMTKIDVPVRFKSNLKNKLNFLKHDSLIMYMEVEEYE